MTFTISQNHEIKTVVELLRKCHKQSKSLPFHDYIASTLNTDTIITNKSYFAVRIPYNLK